MTPLEQFAGGEYLNLETFRRDGRLVRTPVWFVQDGEKLYIRTLAGSGKVKRLRHTPQVNVALCDQVGMLTGAWLPATAREITQAPALYEKVDQLLEQKYGERKRQMQHQVLESGRRYTLLEVVFP